MSKLVATAFMSLDGIIKDPGEWQMPWFDDDARRYARERLFASGALLLGRGTYDMFAAGWPNITDEDGYADRINSMPKYVVSTTSTEAGWQNSTVIDGNDVTGEVAKLKQRPGADILIFGAGRLAHTMLQHDLLDELEIWVHPVLLGDPNPDGLLAREGSRHDNLELARTVTTGSGVVICSYTPRHG